MTKKYLWGHEFTLVKNGLAEDEVETFVKSLRDNGNSLLEQADRLGGLKDQSERMNTVVSEVLEKVRGFYEDATREAEHEGGRMLEEARKTAEAMVSAAEESAHSIKQQAEETAKEYSQEMENKIKGLEADAEAARSAARAAKSEAEYIIAEAEVRAKEIEQEAVERASSIDHEAKERASNVYSESKEQAEELVETAVARMRRLMETESESLLQSLDSMRDENGSKEPQAEISPADEREPAQWAHPSKSMELMDLERPDESGPVEAQASTNGKESAVALASEVPDQDKHLQKLEEAPQPAETPALYEGKVQVLLPSDVNILTLWSIRDVLETTKGVTVATQVTTGNEISIEALLESPVPLAEILGSLPEVSNVVETEAEVGSSGSYFGGPDASPPARKLRLITN